MQSASHTIQMSTVFTLSSVVERENPEKKVEESRGWKSVMD